MFYVIEKSSQLPSKFGNCFIRFIPKSNNFHPALTDLSLVYIRPLDDKKGYIICIDHTEAFSISKAEVTEWLINNTEILWVLDKKEALHWMYPLDKQLNDAHFIDFIDLTQALGNRCIDYYYSKYPNFPNVNCLIPISKHYEESEVIFNAVLPIIKKYSPTLIPTFLFNNFHTTNVFYEIEKNGIKADKTCFINHYKDKLHYPEYNLYKGKLYTYYNLYNTTSRPSNTFNNINFAALNKDNGERKCYKPENDKFIELDFQGYHPRIIGNLVGFDFPKDRNTYDYLGELLGVSQQDAKELTFKQLYGGVWSEYQDKPFFKEVGVFVDNLWDTFQHDGTIKSHNKIFIRDQLEGMNPQKLFNYLIQSQETANNVCMLEKVLNYLKDKKTKIILYTYDAFLFDYTKEDGEIFETITQLLQYPVSIKQGKTYHGLEKL